MIVSVWSEKGGQGKTPFALSIAKDLALYLQSNDESIIDTVYENAVITKQVTLLEDCVYDFGGFLEKGVLPILAASNLIIIPCTPNYNAILKTVKTITELENINKNILVLATGYTDQKQVDMIIDTLKENFTFLKFLRFKHSKIIENILSTGKSINELCNESPLSKVNYARFHTEYTELLNIIKNNT